MLKIYLQIFGTLALGLIILLNYNVFMKKPNKEKIVELQKEMKTLEVTAQTLDKVLNHRPHFGTLENFQSQDLDDVRVFYADSFNEPAFMGKLQKLVDLSGCTTNGIIVGNIKGVSNPLKYEFFKTKQKENLEKSINSFVSTMDEYAGNTAKWQSIVGDNSDYSSRLVFYHSISGGKKFPSSMNKGFEVHRFKLNLKGNYTSCKKFLYLVSRNRPFTEAIVHSFVPINEKQGVEKMFACRVTILTYRDKNEKMHPIQKMVDVQV
ncbi:hypothetical protein J7L05_09075 [bacterium]|nr:hypothetical protein [bacterium]